MSIREIDDRYPEFAKPYEPIKGRKRYKKLSFASELLLVMGAVLILTSALLTGSAAPQALPVIATPSPTPAPTATPAPEPSPTPGPSATPEPEPSPTPEPSATSEPSPSPTPAPTATPTPTPAGPKEPKVSLSHIYYWDQVGHVELEYVITANDATGISSYAEVSSMADPALGFSTDTFSGAGTITANENVWERMEVRSADTWKVKITLQYTLGGQAKTKTFTLTQSPKLQGLLRLYTIGTSSTGPDVTCDLGFYYPTAYEHSFDLEPFEIRLGWMDSDYNVIEDEYRVIWDWWGPSPLTGPEGPEADGEDSILKYRYTGSPDMMPTPAAVDAGAAYYFLIFDISGGATYSGDGEVYSMAALSARSAPLPLPMIITEGEKPTLNFTHLWYWGEFNITEGIQLFELAYQLTPNDGTDISVDARLSYDSWEYTWTGLTQTGTVKLKQDTAGEPFNNSSMSWTPEFTLHYKLNGLDYTESYSFPALHPTGFTPSFQMTRDSGGITFTLTKAGADPFTYSVDGITRISVEWFKSDGGSGWDYLGESQVWPGSGTLDTVTTGSVYRFNGTLSGLTPPADATHFMLVVQSGSYTGVDENGASHASSSSFYTYDDFRPISELTP